jgi:hypothetical protein
VLPTARRSAIVASHPAWLSAGPDRRQRREQFAAGLHHPESLASDALRRILIIS